MPGIGTGNSPGTSNTGGEQESQPEGGQSTPEDLIDQEVIEAANQERARQAACEEEKKVEKRERKALRRHLIEQLLKDEGLDDLSDTTDSEEEEEEEEEADDSYIIFEESAHSENNTEVIRGKMPNYKIDTSRVVILTGPENFDGWKRQIMLILGSTKLAALVKGTDTRANRADDPAKTQWDADNDSALLAMVQTLSPDLQVATNSYLMATEIYKYLESRFNKTTSTHTV